LAKKRSRFNKQAHYTGSPLPKGIRMMNPFTESNQPSIATAFYQKYYSDPEPRHLILGINPGLPGLA
jgi:hypothetical protein